tara:strand:- start:207173 stop:207313 length:141 start_codon:yes stop_codon:yes gene_type:complete
MYDKKPVQESDLDEGAVVDARWRDATISDVKKDPPPAALGSPRNQK